MNHDDQEPIADWERELLDRKHHDEVVARDMHLAVTRLANAGARFIETVRTMLICWAVFAALVLGWKIHG